MQKLLEAFSYIYKPLNVSCTKQMLSKPSITKAAASFHYHDIETRVSTWLETNTKRFVVDIHNKECVFNSSGIQEFRIDR